MSKIIVHISNDYPDILAPNKTKAVLNLVEGTPQYRHIVYSLNRVNGFDGLSSLPFGEGHMAVAYGALPKGLFWEKRLREVAEWILSDLKKRKIIPDIIEAHKFTIEGLIGQDLAKAFKVPLICDIQGYTDINILRKKPAWRERFKLLSEQCAAIFPYAPWPMVEFKKKINLDEKKCHILPVIPTTDHMMPAPVIGKNKLLSVFHLDGWQNKNFEGMVLAVKRVMEEKPDIILDIYGGGSPKSLLSLQDVLDAHDIHDHVHLKGPIDNKKIQETMQDYTGFVMPSKSESYGLVYIEALFSGVPILFNKDRGISGYYTPSDIGYGADAHDSDDIAVGMGHLLDNEEALKKNIEKMQKQGDFKKLCRAEILKTYTGVIDGLLGQG